MTLRLPPLLTVAAAFALLVACGPRQEAPPAPETPMESEAPAYPALTGLFSATSTTAMGVTGDLAVTPERITLSKGVQLDTGPASAISPTAKIAAGQPSFAETYVGPVGLALELRKVTATTIGDGTTPQPLCGPSTPATHVAFAYDAEQTAVTMLVFSGDEAPGDAATKSQLCGVFAYSG
ncbi:MAG: hypothetical protein JNM47_07515 [Hyphomonadaceae bacterium]|nr:hypothetical protein [Hyphomonadaceae bacterium]